MFKNIYLSLLSLRFHPVIVVEFFETPRASICHLQTTHHESAYAYYSEWCYLDNIDISRNIFLCFSHQASAAGLAHYGQGNGTIWLDDVSCTGSEPNILMCAHQKIGHNNCHHSEDVGVVCMDGMKMCFS